MHIFFSFVQFFVIMVMMIVMHGIDEWYRMVVMVSWIEY